MNRPIRESRTALFQSIALMSACALVLFVVAHRGACAEPMPENEVAIAKEVAAIDRALPKLETRERALQGTSSEGAEVETYAKGGRYVKINVEELNEKGRVFRNFYFDSGQLIEAVIQQTRYNNVEGPNRTDKVVATDTYIFVGKKLIRWITSGQLQKDTNAVYQKMQDDVAAEANGYAALMDTPGPDLDGGGAWFCASAGASIKKCESFRHE